MGIVISKEMEASRNFGDRARDQAVICPNAFPLG